MMNTTPTISNSTNQDRYTVVSGAVRDLPEFEGVSVVLLNRGGKPFKSRILSQLYDLKLKEIVSVETSRQIFEMENLASKFENVKFLTVSDQISIGERINIAAKVCSGSHILVFWNDMDLQIRSQADRIFNLALEGDFLCRVPLLLNTNNETIPIRFAPAFTHKKWEIYPLTAVRNKMPTLYPYDFCGIYNKQKFLLTGGYDKKYTNPYWQKLDFGLRCALWGETIETVTTVKLRYTTELPRENTTRDADYSRFFLKNLAIKFHGDSCSLPFGNFLYFAFKSGSNILFHYRLFREIQEWVNENSLRFKTDTFNLTELWEMDN